MPRILAMNGLTKSCLEAAMIEMTKKPEMAAQCLLEECMKETNGVKKCREFCWVKIRFIQCIIVRFYKSPYL